MQMNRNFQKEKESQLLLIPSAIAVFITVSYLCSLRVKIEFYTIEAILKERDHYYFYTNPGNLGDMLINYAEIQLFARIGLNFTIKMYTDINETFDLILGGGGRYIENYMCGDDTWDLLKSPYLRSCIMLSASIRGCDELVSEIFDERFTVLLREADSYEYCVRLNSKSRFIRANDMALYINISQVNFDTLFPNDIIGNNETFINESNKASDDLESLIGLNDYTAFQYKRYTFSMDLISEEIKDNSYVYNGQTVNFYFRHDGEKRLTDAFTKQFKSYDLPLTAWVDHTRMENIALWCRIFLGIVDSSDIVVTDRLHVGIAASLLNKTVYMYDNTYGKASGIYETSLACFRNVHILETKPSGMSYFPLSPLRKIRGSLISEKAKPFFNMSYKAFVGEFQRYSNVSQF